MTKYETILPDSVMKPEEKETTDSQSDEEVYAFVHNRQHRVEDQSPDLEIGSTTDHSFQEGTMSPEWEKIADLLLSSLGLKPIPRKDAEDLGLVNNELQEQGLKEEFLKHQSQKMGHKLCQKSRKNITLDDILKDMSNVCKKCQCKNSKNKDAPLERERYDNLKDNEQTEREMKGFTNEFRGIDLKKEQDRSGKKSEVLPLFYFAGDSVFYLGLLNKTSKTVEVRNDTSGRPVQPHLLPDALKRLFPSNGIFTEEGQQGEDSAKERNTPRTHSDRPGGIRIQYTVMKPEDGADQEDTEEVEPTTETPRNPGWILYPMDEGNNLTVTSPSVELSNITPKAPSMDESYPQMKMGRVSTNNVKEGVTSRSKTNVTDEEFNKRSHVCANNFKEIMTRRMKANVTENKVNERFHIDEVEFNRNTHIPGVSDLFSVFVTVNNSRMHLGTVNKTTMLEFLRHNRHGISYPLADKSSKKKSVLNRTFGDFYPFKANQSNFLQISGKNLGQNKKPAHGHEKQNQTLKMNELTEPICTCKPARNILDGLTTINLKVLSAIAKQYPVHVLPVVNCQLHQAFYDRKRTAHPLNIPNFASTLSTTSGDTGGYANGFHRKDIDVLNQHQAKLKPTTGHYQSYENPSPLTVSVLNESEKELERKPSNLVSENGNLETHANTSKTKDNYTSLMIIDAKKSDVHMGLNNNENHWDAIETILENNLPVMESIDASRIKNRNRSSETRDIQGSLKTNYPFLNNTSTTSSDFNNLKFESSKLPPHNTTANGRYSIIESNFQKNNISKSDSVLNVVPQFQRSKYSPADVQKLTNNNLNSLFMTILTNRTDSNIRWQAIIPETDSKFKNLSNIALVPVSFRVDSHPSTERTQTTGVLDVQQQVSNVPTLKKNELDQRYPHSDKKEDNPNLILPEKCCQSQTIHPLLTPILTSTHINIRASGNLNQPRNLSEYLKTYQASNGLPTTTAVDSSIENLMAVLRNNLTALFENGRHKEKVYNTGIAHNIQSSTISEIVDQNLKIKEQVKMSQPNSNSEVKPSQFSITNLPNKNINPTTVANNKNEEFGLIVIPELEQYPKAQTSTTESVAISKLETANKDYPTACTPEHLRFCEGECKHPTMSANSLPPEPTTVKLFVNKDVEDSKSGTYLGCQHLNCFANSTTGLINIQPRQGSCTNVPTESSNPSVSRTSTLSKYHSLNITSSKIPNVYDFKDLNKASTVFAQTYSTAKTGLNLQEKECAPSNASNERITKPSLTIANVPHSGSQTDSNQKNLALNLSLSISCAQKFDEATSGHFDPLVYESAKKPIPSNEWDALDFNVDPEPMTVCSIPQCEKNVSAPMMTPIQQNEKYPVPYKTWSLNNENTKEVIERNAFDVKKDSITSSRQSSIHERPSSFSKHALTDQNMNTCQCDKQGISANQKKCGDFSTQGSAHSRKFTIPHTKEPVNPYRPSPAKEPTGVPQQHSSENGLFDNNERSEVFTENLTTQISSDHKAGVETDSSTESAKTSKLSGPTATVQQMKNKTFKSTIKDSQSTKKTRTPCTHNIATFLQVKHTTITSTRKDTESTKKARTRCTNPSNPCNTKTRTQSTNPSNLYNTFKSEKNHLLITQRIFTNTIRTANDMNPCLIHANISNSSNLPDTILMDKYAKPENHQSTRCADTYITNPMAKPYTIVYTTKSPGSDSSKYDETVSSAVKYRQTHHPKVVTISSVDSQHYSTQSQDTIIFTNRFPEPVTTKCLNPCAHCIISSTTNNLETTKRTNFPATKPSNLSNSRRKQCTTPSSNYSPSERFSVDTTKSNPIKASNNFKTNGSQSITTKIGSNSNPIKSSNSIAAKNKIDFANLTTKSSEMWSNMLSFTCSRDSRERDSQEYPQIVNIQGVKCIFMKLLDKVPCTSKTNVAPKENEKGLSHDRSLWLLYPYQATNKQSVGSNKPLQPKTNKSITLPKLKIYAGNQTFPDGECLCDLSNATDETAYADKRNPLMKWRAFLLSTNLPKDDRGPTKHSKQQSQTEQLALLQDTLLKTSRPITSYKDKNGKDVGKEKRLPKNSKNTLTPSQRKFQTKPSSESVGG